MSDNVMFDVDGLLTDQEADQRVARGVGFLNQNLEDGWADRLDRKVFDITDLHYCIGGQLYPSWYDLEERVGGTDDILRHGFDVQYGHADKDGSVLNAAWNRALDKLSA